MASPETPRSPVAHETDKVSPAERHVTGEVCSGGEDRDRPGGGYRRIIESLGACPYSAIPLEDGGFRMEFGDGCVLLTGYSASDHSADPSLWSRSILPEDIPALEGAIARALSGAGLVRLEHHIRHRDGSIRRLRNTLISVWDNRGRCFRFDGALRDAAEPNPEVEVVFTRRRSANGVETSPLKVCRMPDHEPPRKEAAEGADRPPAVPLAAYVTDIHGRILDCDSAFAVLFGFESAETALWTLITDLYLEKSEREEELRLLQWNGTLRQHPCERRRRDGTSLHLIEELVGEFNIEGNLTRINGTVLARAPNEPASKPDDPFRRIVETSNEGIWVVGADLKATYVNDVMARMLGYTPEELLGKTFLSLVHEDDVEDHRREMEKRQRGLPGKYIRRLRRKDGTTLSAIVSAVSLLDSEGGFKGSIAMCVDVTSLEQTREALRKSEERWKFALEGSDEGVWDFDLRTGELFLSPGMQELLGAADTTPLRGMDALMRRIHEEDVERFSDAMRSHLAGVTDQLHLEYRLRRDDGSRRWVLARGKVVERGGTGEPFRIIGTCTDITVRKEAEEAIRRSEEYYRTILRTSIDGFHMLNMEGRILDVNDAFCQMTGYGRQELLRMNISDIDTGRDSRRVALLSRTIMRQGGKRFEALHRTRSGDPIDVEVSVNYVPSEGGRLFCFARDISLRRKNERLLEESRELYRMVTESISDIVTLMDEHGVIRYVSPSIEQITGWKVKDILGGNPAELAHPDDLADVKRAFASLREGGKEVGFEFRFRCSNGEYKWIEQNVRVVPGLSGFPRRYVLSARDVTRRRLVEEELRQNEEKYRHLFEMESDALALIDIESEEIIEVNSSACRLYGYAREELLGMKHYDVSAQPEQSRGTVSHRRTLVLQRTHRKKDGTVFPVEISLAYLTFKGRESLIAAIRDVTDRKRMEEELLRARKFDAMSILAGGIAHDFNNLMGIVLGNIEMAEMEFDPDHASRKYLAEARKSTLKSREITQRFLNLSSAGHLSKLATRTAPIIETALACVVNEKNVPVLTSIPDDIWRVRVDRREMGQALGNALQNAIDVAPPGSHVSVRVENVMPEDLPRALGLPKHPHVKIEITDQGEGISDEHLPRIFDPYFTTKQRGTRKGTGLGLAITHAAVIQHDGRIQVESKPGLGTVFTIYLPALES